MSPDQPECLWCERGLALVGLLLGTAVAFIGLDVLTNGMLTRRLTRTGAGLASVTELRQADDEPA
jgi:hypothetical protein